MIVFNRSVGGYYEEVSLLQMLRSTAFPDTTDRLYTMITHKYNATRLTLSKPNNGIST